MILLLVPTQREADLLEKHLQFQWQSGICELRLCGFGPVISAATSARLIEQKQPSTIILAGIAGSYSPDRPPGSASVFSHVTCYGIGVGTGSAFKTAAGSGWPQLQSANSSANKDDSIELHIPEGLSEVVSDELLTVTSAAAGPNDVQLRMEKFPSAEAEEMEGFSVAAACHLTGVPVTIIRGISNVAGDRDQSNWKIESAMKAVARLVDRAVLIAAEKTTTDKR